MNITFRQGAQLSPVVKQQIRAAVSTATPGFKIVEMNTTEFVKNIRQQLNIELTHHEQEEEDYNSSEELEEWDEPEYSLAYTQCSIEGQVTPVIIDTGAGGCMISEYLLKKIGWTVEAATRQTIVVADGHVSRPLGRIFELPVQFGPVTISIGAMVVNTNSYDLVLGNTWLRKAKAIVNLDALKMRFTWKGRTFDVPIDINRGIRPRFVDDSDKEEQYAVHTRKGKQVDGRVIQFQRLKENAVAPVRGTPQSAGVDLMSPETVEVPAYESVVIDTGLAFSIPDRSYRQILPRSSLAKIGLTVDGGVIDPDYRGPVKIIIVNGNKFLPFHIYAGDRIVQLVIIKTNTEEFIEGEVDAKETERADQGFGSTGMNAVTLKKNITELKHMAEDMDKHTYAMGEQLNDIERGQIRRLTTEFED